MFTIRRSLLASAATVALAGFAVLGASAPADAATVNGAGRVGICKATGSSSHPFVFVYRSTSSLAAGRYSADDLIPAFTYTTADGTPGMFMGQNTSGPDLTAACVPVTAVTHFIW